jgi:hypothetical protein
MKNKWVLVKTKTGKIGKAKVGSERIKSKVPVYLQEDNNTFSKNGILCTGSSLIVIGFLD